MALAIKELEKMSDVYIIQIMLRDKLSKLINSESPLAKRLKRICNELDHPILIEVLGGVAEVTHNTLSIDVKIIDHDNEKVGE